jgi:lipid-binding SYLF domain-containing protein
MNLIAENLRRRCRVTWQRRSAVSGQLRNVGVTLETERADAASKMLPPYPNTGVEKSADVLEEIWQPDKGIPRDLLEKARRVAIIPGEEKAAFIFGGNYGKGLASCRTATGWSAPMFVAVGGGSFGFQIGGSFTDVVILPMNDHALQSLLGENSRLAPT